MLKRNPKSVVTPSQKIFAAQMQLVVVLDFAVRWEIHRM